jgi:hypothetical protein
MTQLQAQPAAGWYVDPSGRHEARYWDGNRWTDRIADRGVENHDAQAAAAGEAQAAAPAASTVQVDGPTEPAEADEVPSSPEAHETTSGHQAGDPPAVADAPAAESAGDPYADFFAEQAAGGPVVDAASDPFADFFAGGPTDVSITETAPFADSPFDSAVDSPVDSPVESPVDSPVDEWADAPTFVASVEQSSPVDTPVDSWADSPVVDSPVVDAAPFVAAASDVPVVDTPVDPWTDSPTFDSPAADVTPFVAPVAEPPVAAPAAAPPLVTPPFIPPPLTTPPVVTAPVDLPVAAASGSPEVGWYPDPACRHEVRYWDGGRWTERVANNGVEQMDAPAADILDVSVDAPLHAAAEFSGVAAPAVEYSPDWYPDPTGRHEMRYFDGATWTEHVANNGLSALDPIADGAPVAAVESTLTASLVPAVSTAASPNATTAEAAEAAFAAALKPAAEETPEPEPVVKQLPVRPDWATKPNALVGWIVVIGAAVLAIGSLGPWAKATAPVVGEVTQNGTSGDGRFMLAIALLLLITGGGLIAGRLGRVVAFSALSLGTLAAIVCAVDMARISNGTYGLLQGTADVTSSAGIGLWACLVGAIVCIAGGIVAVTHR